MTPPPADAGPGQKVASPARAGPEANPYDQDGGCWIDNKIT